jgi:hypothetical protein
MANLMKFILIAVVVLICGVVGSVVGWLGAAPMVNYYPHFTYGGLPGYEGWALLGEQIGFVLGLVVGATFVWLYFKRRK